MDTSPTEDLGHASILCFPPPFLCQPSSPCVPIMIIFQPHGHIFLLASTWPLPYLAAWMCHGNEPDLPGKESFFDVEGPCYMA